MTHIWPGPGWLTTGSVWPHDNAVIAAGLMRYGFVEEAQRIATALLDAADHSEGRLPELFCGFSREQYSEPVPYPTACSAQAWAATSSIQLVASLMRYDAHVSHGGFWMDPQLPASYGDLHITNAPMAGGWVTIDIADSVPNVQGLADGMVFHQGHRPWLTETLPTPDQWQSRTLQRHPSGGMGLRPDLHFRGRTPGLLPGLHRTRGTGRASQERLGPQLSARRSSSEAGAIQTPTDWDAGSKAVAPARP